MEAFQLDTLDWVRLRCAACGQSAEILQLDLEAEGGARICSPCCGALLVPIDDAFPDGPESEESPQKEAPQTELTRQSSDSGDSRLGPSELSCEERKSVPRSVPLPPLEVPPDDDEFDTRADVWGNPRRNSASIVVSVAVHGVVLLLLAAIVLHLPQQAANDILYASFDQTAEKLASDAANQAKNDALAETVDLSLPSEQPSELPQPAPVAAAVPEEAELAAAPSSLNPADDQRPSTRDSSVRPGTRVSANSGAGSESQSGNVGGSSKSQNGSASESGWSIPSGGGFSGRRADVRRQLAALTGATPASEAAVEAGLKWLAAHQRKDGSWSLQHSVSGCGGRCLPGSSMDCPTAATGLALLCFLGAGHSHAEGDYQQEVQRGLDWLVAQSREGDLRTSLDHVVPEGRSAMYAHGIASMALCEAYGMTLDRTLI